MRILQLSITTLILMALSMTALAAKYEEVDVAYGGTISGQVLYHGPVKTRTVLPTKDREVCGDPRKQPLIVVSEDGAVKDSVVFLKGVRSGKPWPEMELERPTIDNIDCRFEPRVQVMRGGEIDILNSDPVLHNTKAYYGRRTAFNVALPTQGLKVTQKLSRPGEVRVDCDAHGWMLGWVYVVDNPYFAQTGEDGVFSIRDVPPGEYTLVVWQEELGATEMPVQVAAGEATEMSIELKR